MSLLTRHLRLRAPASTANLGSAFDCAAIALGLYNELEAEPSGADHCEIDGEGSADLHAGAPNLVLTACERLCAVVGKHRPPLALRQHNAIPLGRGLGSSAAAIAAGLRLGEALTGERLLESQLLTLAADIEGHADNTTAALLGGCTIAVRDESGGIVAVRVALPDDLRFVVFVPDYAVATSQARAALPADVPRADAVFNVGRAALLVAALSSGRVDALGLAMDDRLHQPYRAPLYRGMAELLAAARQAGAYGAAVSGAGPSAIALSHPNAVAAVADAFMATGQAHGVSGRVVVLEAAAQGAGTLTQEKSA